MRKLSNFENTAQARALASALTSEGVAASLREGADGSCAVWVMEEEQLDTARAVLAAWTQDPSSFADAAPVASEPETPPTTTVQGTAPKVSGPAASKPRQRGLYVSLRLRSARAPLTMSMLGISALVALVSNFGNDARVLQNLTIMRQIQVPGHFYDDLGNGELWRLITPVFIHFGFLHLLFNSFWLLDLGAAIERAWGSARLGAMLLVCAAASNLTQLYFGGSAAFGGLSGLVYACIGYLWARGRFDPTSPIGAPQQLVTFFIVYLALGFSGVLDGLGGRLANYCHLGGFVSGIACGLLAALLGRQRLRRSSQT